MRYVRRLPPQCTRAAAIHSQSFGRIGARCGRPLVRYPSSPPTVSATAHRYFAPVHGERYIPRLLSEPPSNHSANSPGTVLRGLPLSIASYEISSKLTAASVMPLRASATEHQIVKSGQIPPSSPKPYDGTYHASAVEIVRKPTGVTKSASSSRARIARRCC